MFPRQKSSIIKTLQKLKIGPEIHQIEHISSLPALAKSAHVENEKTTANSKTVVI